MVATGRSAASATSSLDYISRYDDIAAATLVDRIETIIAETKQTGFHFVDEAAPPKALKALAAETQEAQAGDFMVGQYSL